MDSTTNQPQLHQDQITQMLMGALTSINVQQGLTNELLQRLIAQNSELLYLLNGFTSGGASFNGYLPDAFTSAYLSVLAPVVAQKLMKDDLGFEEIMKGGTVLSRQLLEELGAYRSEQEGKDIVSSLTELLKDPWKKDEQSGNEQPDSA
jgi:hypothetical protein